MLFKTKNAVLSQGELRDTAVNFDTYRILQRHRTCGFPTTARLSCCFACTAVNHQLSKSDKYYTEPVRLPTKRRQVHTLITLNY